MNEAQTLATVQLILERATITLRDCTDLDGLELLHEITNLKQMASFLRRHEECRTPDQFRGLRDRTAIVHEKVRDYAERVGIHHSTLVTPQAFELTETIRMTKEQLDEIRATDHWEEVQAAVESMGDRATEPPGSIIPLLIESQMADIPLPPREIPAAPETSSDLGDTTGDD
jgi:hypothetical protein